MSDVIEDEDDPCPGHPSLIDGLTILPCTLPFGHRRVPEEKP